MTTNNGITTIGRSFAVQPNASLRFVAVFDRRMPVLWNTPRLKKAKARPVGIYITLSLTPMNGRVRNVEGSMSLTTPIVQGFLRVLLNDDEALKALDLARSKGRYLIPAEVSLLIKRELTKTITENEQQNMQGTWIEFCKEKNLDQSTSLTDPIALEVWWDYVSKNYHHPLPASAPWGNDN